MLDRLDRVEALHLAGRPGRDRARRAARPRERGRGLARRRGAGRRGRRRARSTAAATALDARSARLRRSGNSRGLRYDWPKEGANVAAPPLAPTERVIRVRRRGHGHGHGHLVREPERRCRQDDIDPQSRRRASREAAARACRRPRPAGQPDDEPGLQPRRDHAVDVRRARAPAADRARRPPGGDRHRRLVDRPRRRRAGDERDDRPRALARQGAARRSRTITTTSSSTRRRRSAC